jgi:two-component system, NarL family, sensor histidine kinase UhpB
MFAIQGASMLRSHRARQHAADNEVAHALRDEHRSAGLFEVASARVIENRPHGEAARPRGVLERVSRRARRTSLYVRVVLINAAIVGAATVVLVVSPATVGYPISLTEAVVLVAGVACVIFANALVLRLSFASLARTVARMETVDLLRPQERLQLTGGPETRAVAAGLNQMLARLETERRESSRRTLAAVEGERRRIALELHDEIGQRLTGMLLQLGDLVPDAPADLHGRITAVQEGARATIDEVGSLAWQLRPGILDDLGLVRALEALVESYEERRPDVRVQTSPTGQLPPLAPEVELAVYRIAQEAITNAVRHAGADTVVLAIDVGGRRLSLRVGDDGTGIAADRSEDAGIRGMRERALAIGATLTIESARAAGTTVALELPLTDAGG